jgi:HrpA-like RNA helicase
MHGKFLLDSLEMGCAKEVLTIAAMMSVDSPLYSPRSMLSKANKIHARHASYDADHVTLLNIHNAFIEAGRDKQWCSANFIKHNTMLKAERVRQQLVEMVLKVTPGLKKGQDFPSCLPDVVPVLQCLVRAFSLRVAQMLPRDNQAGVRYQTVMESIETRIHPSSWLSRRDPMPEWIVFNELVLTSKKYLKCVAAVDQKWLPEFAPTLFAMQQNKRRISARQKNREDDAIKRRSLLMCD